jgi:hypothetical protein
VKQHLACIRMLACTRPCASVESGACRPGPTNGGRIEVAQHMAGDSNAKTKGLYDRRNDDISVGEVKKIWT